MVEKIQFKQAYPLNTPILFLVFNRLDTTKQVFEAIKQVKPLRLYIASDGPRANKEGEDKKVEAVRDFILKSIDWHCEVKTLFREQNLGCKYAVSGAITWFFENEEQGIILEDDCLPSQSFFWYCEELLDRYKDDLRIWHISGDNFQDGIIRGNDSYYFSKYNHIWGWASWRNRWAKYDVEIASFKEFSNQQTIQYLFESTREWRYWKNIFCDVSTGKIDTWDYQWTYCVWTNYGLSILPNKNLVSNIGFGSDATHTKDLDSKHSKIPREDIAIPLSSPKFIVVHADADRYTKLLMYNKFGLFKRFLNMLKNILNEV